MSRSMPLRSRSLPLSAGQKSRNEQQLNEEEVADIKRLIASIATERKTDAPEDEVTRTSPSTTQRVRSLIVLSVLLLFLLLHCAQAHLAHKLLVCCKTKI